MTPREFAKWLEKARVNDECVYHQGATASENRSTAQAAYDAAKNCQVFLYQRRVAVGVFNYIARKVEPKCGELIRPWGHPDAE